MMSYEVIISVELIMLNYPISHVARHTLSTEVGSLTYTQQR